MKKPDREKIFSDRLLGRKRMSYIDFVRYMRWYTVDHRSYLLRKIEKKGA